MKVINGKKYYTAFEVADLCSVTRNTLIRWYEYEETTGRTLLPPFIRVGGNHARYWSEDDIEKILTFKTNKVKGEMKVISDKYSGKYKK